MPKTPWCDVPWCEHCDELANLERGEPSRIRHNKDYGDGDGNWLKVAQFEGGEPYVSASFTCVDMTTARTHILRVLDAIDLINPRDEETQ